MSEQDTIDAIEADLDKLDKDLSQERGLNLLLDLYTRIRKLAPSRKKSELMQRQQKLERAVLNARTLAHS